MAEEANDEQTQEQGGELLTLSEISNRTGISMPTLQRYKKNFQDRIPSVGRGRKQRYPASALPVFEEIKKENVKKRGRPRKGSGAGRKTGGGKRSAGAGEGLLTLTEVSERTGISYPTLVRYVKLHGDRIPSEGEGRRRRYHPKAVEVFREIRSESPRGRRKKGAPAAGGGGRGTAADSTLARRVASLERSQERLEKQIRALIKNLQKPLKVTIQRPS